MVRAIIYEKGLGTKCSSPGVDYPSDLVLGWLVRRPRGSPGRAVLARARLERLRYGDLPIPLPLSRSLSISALLPIVIALVPCTSWDRRCPPDSSYIPDFRHTSTTFLLRCLSPMIQSIISTTLRRYCITRHSPFR